MNRKTLKVLELDKILHTLSEHAVIAATREKLAHIEPVTELSEITRALSETDEARIITVKYGRPPISALTDVSGAVKRTQKGAALSCGELLGIAHVLRVSRLVLKYIDFRGFEADFPILNSVASYLVACRELEQRIFDCIISEEDVDDNASVELSKIRRKKTSLTNKVKDILNEIIRSSAYSSALQESIISIRGDRYVVPVKSEQKSIVPGVVHDTSQSGGTLFVEPMKVVETNNEIRRLAAEEEEEILHILAEMSAQAAEISTDIIENFNILAQLDMVFAKASYADKINAAMPLVNDKNIIEIKKGRHPLIDPTKVVPVDIRVGGDFDTLVITGPNTGGKTVCLKTLGLFTLMAQCGLHVPCGEGSRLAVFEDVFADIGDEQSIEQSLSTFSSHMVNISGIIKECGPRSLVLFDELGAGTDPAEGAALATAILKNVRMKGAVTAATTHYSEIKMYALTTDGVENAACEFDVNSLKPTYKLHVGALGKSCAFDIAARLGIGEDIIGDARGLMDAESAKFEDVVNTLEENRIRTSREREEAEQNRFEAQKIRQRLEREDAELKKRQGKVIDEARREAKKLLDSAKSEIEEKLREIDRAAKLKDEAERAKALERAKQELRRSSSKIGDKMYSSAFKAGKKANPADILPGSIVYLPAMNNKGTVISVPDKNGNMEVMVGILKIKTNISTVETLSEGTADYTKPIKTAAPRGMAEGVKTEVDLRGMTLDEALDVVDKYIDDATLAHLGTVTIIHGRGTGVLKSGITKHLRGNKAVASFRLGKYGEGGDGVTIAELK